MIFLLGSYIIKEYKYDKKIIRQNKKNLNVWWPLREKVGGEICSAFRDAANNLDELITSELSLSPSRHTSRGDTETVVWDAVGRNINFKSWINVCLLGRARGYREGGNNALG